MPQIGKQQTFLFYSSRKNKIKIMENIEADMEPSDSRTRCDVQP